LYRAVVVVVVVVVGVAAAAPPPPPPSSASSSFLELSYTFQMITLLPWRKNPQWARSSSLSRLVHDQTQFRHTRIDRTSLDE